ncbi:MAG: SDR family oxidoreductase [Campylobacterales bacterium]|nr:SDR family oxidoreductase [Campylobacterales bacterium]
MVIIGKNSNLTHCVKKSYSKTASFSSQEILENVNILNQFRGVEFAVLFNNFQTAKYLSSVNNIEDYVNRSLTVTAKVLDHIKDFQNVKKIMYTSSSSVYGDNDYCNETDVPHPINLQASLKLANEFFIGQYCRENKIDYTILRVFNMFGGDDNFSIISKIIRAIKEKVELTLVNDGAGIRDFIHIDDVVKVILKVLPIENLPILNVGTGRGKSVKKILIYLESHNIFIQTKSIANDNEIRVSVANAYKVSEIIKKEFIAVEEYILNELNKG